jgi:hypothetical protein
MILRGCVETPKCTTLILVLEKLSRKLDFVNDFAGTDEYIDVDFTLQYNPRTETQQQDPRRWAVHYPEWRVELEEEFVRHFNEG